MTGQEATSPLPAFLAAGHQRAGVAMAVTKPPPALFPLHFAQGIPHRQTGKAHEKKSKKSFPLFRHKKNNLQQRILLQPLKPLLGIFSFGPVCPDSRAVIYRRHLFIIVISILPSSSPGAALTPSTLPLPGGLPAGKPLPSLRLQKPGTKTSYSPFFPSS